MATVLAAAGYGVRFDELSEVGEVLLAETRHALVLAVVTSWDAAADVVDDAETALTRLAAQSPSPRSWDLYVIVVITDARDDHVVRERLEHDTRYARKLVAAAMRGGHIEDVERALLPLLPLRGAAKLEQMEPREAMRRELLEQDVAEDVVDAGLRSFFESGTVAIP